MDWDELQADLHCRLGAILKEKGMSALKLSEELDHRRSTINDLVNNKDMRNKRIPAQLIARICVYLDITPNELFTIIQSKEEEPS
ncbi:helix-turn-helix transcriptional regulator [Paenibacillus sp. FSL E2-0230]|uniref:helix-turn-helix domain-containing protein n=1 Tax=Paenibacillus sp. FSL E2-0230 TaxID=2954727 RepID=UPI0030CF7B99